MNQGFWYKKVIISDKYLQLISALTRSFNGAKSLPDNPWDVGPILAGL
jgi:hypothetical protein